MITVSLLKKKLELLECEGHGNLPVIYSGDDEGNSYHHVNYYPTLMEVRTLDATFLEIVEKTGNNCVCIN